MQSTGLVTRRDDDGYTYYEAVSHSERWQALRSIVRHFAQPAEVLRAALRDVPGIDVAFVFGSTAKNDAREDSDIDLFVIGDAIDRNQLAAETLEISALLNREVNVVHYTWRRS
jgi:predicted nucleotidyltransferase